MLKSLIQTLLPTAFILGLLSAYSPVAQLKEVTPPAALSGKVVMTKGQNVTVRMDSGIKNIRTGDEVFLGFSADNETIVVGSWRVTGIKDNGLVEAEPIPFDVDGMPNIDMDAWIFPGTLELETISFEEEPESNAAPYEEELNDALDLYRLDTGRYPSTEEGLEALIRRPTGIRYWDGPYLVGSKAQAINKFTYKNIDGKPILTIKDETINVEAAPLEADGMPNIDMDARIFPGREIPDGLDKQLDDALEGLFDSTVEPTRHVVSTASALFSRHCAECHGVKGEGTPGFPALDDNDWLYSGDLRSLVSSIIHGRRGVMTAHVKTMVLTRAEAEKLAKWVTGMKNEGKPMEHDPAAKEMFMTKGCIACHGLDAKGIDAIGGADLTNEVWRFQPGGYESALYTISHGVNDVSDDKTRLPSMPSFKDVLTHEEIEKLASYVSLLSDNRPPERNQSRQTPRVPDAELDKGRSLYENVCFVCHMAGVSGAPKLGDRHAWAPRINKGFDVLYASALDGIPGTAMPPRGTCAECSDADIRAAVKYMIEEVRTVSR